MVRSRLFLAWASAAAFFAGTAPALAQDGEGANYFEAFFTPDGVGVGTAIVWLLLFMSVAIIALIIQNALATRERAFIPPQTVETLDQLISEKNFRAAIDRSAEDHSPFGKVVHAGLTEASRGYPAMEEAIEETADDIGNHRLRRLVWLEVAGAAGPMLGLFGTVFGMIVAFQQIASTGGQPKPAELAAGIGTALVTTFWGLIVGIPGVVAASLFRTKLDGLTAETIARAKHLIASFRPGGSKRPTTPAPGAGGGPGPATPKPVAT